MNKKKRMQKNSKYDTEKWTEEQYEQYMKGLFDLEFIAVYTEGGVPFGIPLDVNSKENLYNYDSDELPFG